MNKLITGEEKVCSIIFTTVKQSIANSVIPTLISINQTADFYDFYICGKFEAARIPYSAENRTKKHTENRPNKGIN